ncbi:unnamed protein product [Vicia faba]|uniref:Amino acid transporter transmembrane domain-containing protein n=1 Tax=Vicia faba TaxID=3906 RepID=A0AAV0ZLX6_VICFA|nr:unnamed protein product [Vicia faba]
MGVGDERGQPEENSNVDPRQKAIDDWLPVTASREAKWWYSAFHNLTAMVGAGVLTLPYALSNMGWGAGVTVLTLSWVITLYTLWQMVEMHEMIPGKRFDRYHELGQEAFGEKLGLWIVVPQQILVEAGTCIVYMVTGVNFVLSQCPNFNSLSIISLSAAAMSLTYSTIAWAASLKKGIVPNVDYGPRSTSTADSVFHFFSALGDVAFAYAEKPAWLIAAANFFVVIHVIGGYQVFAMPVFDMIETVMVKKLHFPPTFALRFSVRSIYVALTMFIGICIPFFGSLLGFLGGFAFAPTTYFLPCIIWLKLKKPRNLACLGQLMWNIIVQAKDYEFFS